MICQLELSLRENLFCKKHPLVSVIFKEVQGKRWPPPVEAQTMGFTQAKPQPRQWKLLLEALRTGVDKNASQLPFVSDSVRNYYGTMEWIWTLGYGFIFLGVLLWDDCGLDQPRPPNKHNLDSWLCLFRDSKYGYERAICFSCWIQKWVTLWGLALEVSQTNQLMANTFNKGGQCHTVQTCASLPLCMTVHSECFWASQERRSWLLFGILYHAELFINLLFLSREISSVSMLNRSY